MPGYHLQFRNRLIKNSFKSRAIIIGKAKDFALSSVRNSANRPVWFSVKTFVVNPIGDTVSGVGGSIGSFVYRSMEVLIS